MNNSNPYAEALVFIQRNPGTGGASSLAKLVLSLYNSLCGYSFAECVGNLDQRLSDLAIRMVTNYSVHGETEALREVGKLLSDDMYPGLWEMGVAMDGALASKSTQDWAQRRGHLLENGYMQVSAKLLRQAPVI